MKPVSPVIPDKNMPEVIVAEHQDEYQNLPAIRLEGGIVLCRWKLDNEERRRVAETGDIYLLQWTNDGLVTPMLLQTEPPEIPQTVVDVDSKPEPEKIQMMAATRRSSFIVNEARKNGFEITEDNCTVCEHVVVYTDKTVETLADNPELQVICTVCFEEKQRENPELHGVLLPNTASEMAKIFS